VKEIESLSNSESIAVSPFILEPSDPVLGRELFHQADDKRRFSGAEKSGQDSDWHYAMRIRFARYASESGFDATAEAFPKSYRLAIGRNCFRCRSFCGRCGACDGIFFKR
jgi:hypothetical protein